MAKLKKVKKKAAKGKATKKAAPPSPQPATTEGAHEFNREPVPA